MMVLVIGENNSGKSAYAEQLAKSMCGGELYYVATMLPYGPEGAERVAKHRKQRAGMGFTTVESPYGIVETAERDTVLLEDVSNILSNLMFEKRDPEAVSSVLSRVDSLRCGCEHLIAVTIGGITAADGDDAETKEYISALNQVNEALFTSVETVVEMVSGTPVLRKGEHPCSH